MTAKRTDAGAAVAGLFDRPSATGDLAAQPTVLGSDQPVAPLAPPVRSTRGTGAEDVVRLRLGVELTEREVGFLRELSRPARTGQPRTLGSKFVGTGILAAAIELIAAGEIDMAGVAAGDLAEMTARARAALQASPALDRQEATP